MADKYDTLKEEYNVGQNKRKASTAKIDMEQIKRSAPPYIQYYKIKNSRMYRLTEKSVNRHFHNCITSINKKRFLCKFLKESALLRQKKILL